MEQTVLSKYSIDDELENCLIGEGSYAKVFKIWSHSLDRYVALKLIQVCDKTADELKSIKKEVELLQRLQDVETGVKVFDVFEDEEFLYVFMEFLPWTLLDEIEKKGKMSEETAKIVFRQLVYTLEKIHERNVAHRDLKLENVLYDRKSNQIRIIDFGMSDQFKSQEGFEKIGRVVGSPGYIAPEMLKGTSIGYNGVKADVYSLGVILYTMVTGSFPFGDAENLGYYQKYQLTPREDEPTGFTPRRVKPRELARRNSLEQRLQTFQLSVELISLLHSMLDLNCKRRATIQEVKEHQWVKPRTRSFSLTLPIREKKRINPSPLAEIESTTSEESHPGVETTQAF